MSFREFISRKNNLELLDGLKAVRDKYKSELPYIEQQIEMREQGEAFASRIVNTGYNYNEKLHKKLFDLSHESTMFLLDMLEVIERYDLDLSIPGGCIGLYNLRNEKYDDFIEVSREDYEPYCLVKDSPDLSMIIKLMLGIKMTKREDDE